MAFRGSRPFKDPFQLWAGEGRAVHGAGLFYRLSGMPLPGKHLGLFTHNFPRGLYGDPSVVRVAT